MLMVVIIAYAPSFKGALNIKLLPNGGKVILCEH